MNQLTIYEKIILEFIQEGKTSLEDLQKATNLEINFLCNILHSLCFEGFISIRQNEYKLNKDKINEYFKNKLPNQSELYEIVNNSIQNYCVKNKSNCFGITKALLTNSKNSYLKGMLKNIESYIQECHKQNTNKSTEATQKSFFHWGESTYQDLLIS